MSACATQTFNGVSPTAWACLKAKAAAAGFPIASDSGAQSSQGFTITWAYDPNQQSLQVTCTDSPFWAPCSTINGKIHEVIDGTSCLS
jgi:hypothetical protein